MKAWAAAGFFPPQTPIRRKGRAQFVNFDKSPLAPPRPAPKPAPKPISTAPEVWWYIDETGKEQGPWRTEHMRQWFVSGSLLPFIRVRSSKELEAAGDQLGRAPFLPIHSRKCSFVPEGTRFPPGGAPLLPPLPLP